MFREDLHLGLEHGVVQGMVVDDTPSHESSARSDGARSEHESTAGLAERIGHCTPGSCGL